MDASDKWKCPDCGSTKQFELVKTTSPGRGHRVHEYVAHKDVCPGYEEL